MSEAAEAKPVAARCAHFGVCGGCQYQTTAYDEQLRRKRARLAELLEEAAVSDTPEIAVHASEAYEYRNRIRLRVERVQGELRVGYNRAAAAQPVAAPGQFLPITMCPIAAPLLWQVAEGLLQVAASDGGAAAWMDAAQEVEIFCNAEQTSAQATLVCAKKPSLPAEGLERLLRSHAALAGLGAVLVDRWKRPVRTLASAGASGLAYRVREESYWVTRGGFFQVNRFLLAELVGLVCDGRSGERAWDLYAGVGLFSRVLARSFAAVTAVESNPVAAADLRAALARRSADRRAADQRAADYRAVEATTLVFLQGAVLQRERPALVVLDPPRAGVGAEACALLLRVAAPTLVYVSCDPATLARDLGVLQREYRLAELHLVDLFPQTSHLETVAVLQRRA